MQPRKRTLTRNIPKGNGRDYYTHVRTDHSRAFLCLREARATLPHECGLFPLVSCKTGQCRVRLELSLQGLYRLRLTSRDDAKHRRDVVPPPCIVRRVISHLNQSIGDTPRRNVHSCCSGGRRPQFLPVERASAAPYVFAPQPERSSKRTDRMRQACISGFATTGTDVSSRQKA